MMCFTQIFFSTTDSNNGDTCSQLFIGKETDFMKVYPIKTESHSFRALQDFTRTVGNPRAIKLITPTLKPAFIGLYFSGTTE